MSLLTYGLIFSMKVLHFLKNMSKEKSPKVPTITSIMHFRCAYLKKRLVAQRKFYANHFNVNERTKSTKKEHIFVNWLNSIFCFFLFTSVDYTSILIQFWKL